MRRDDSRKQRFSNPQSTPLEIVPSYLSHTVFDGYNRSYGDSSACGAMRWFVDVVVLPGKRLDSLGRETDS